MDDYEGEHVAVACSPEELQLNEDHFRESLAHQGYQLKQDLLLDFDGESGNTDASLHNGVYDMSDHYGFRSSDDQGFCEIQVSTNLPSSLVDIDFASANSAVMADPLEGADHFAQSKSGRDSSRVSEVNSSFADDQLAEVSSNCSDDGAGHLSGEESRSPEGDIPVLSEGKLDDLCEPTHTPVRHPSEFSAESGHSPSSELANWRSTSASSSTSNEEEGREGRRKGSIYELKQIDAPVVHRGDRISTRRQSLLDQYEKDMMGRDSDKGAPREAVKGKVSQLKNTYGQGDQQERMQSLRQEKENELEQVRKAFQERSSEQSEERVESPPKSDEVKSRRSLGSLKERYMAVAHGQKAKDADDSEDDHLDGQDAPDGANDGKAVIKSYDKVEEVRSGESIGNIRSVFQSRSENVSKSPSNAQNVVDSTVVNSARSKFKTMETKRDVAHGFNRPTQRRVKDPKELMEARQKVTYGKEEVLHSGVVKKSVNIEEEMTLAAKEAHAAYKQLVEKQEEPSSPVRKPVTRLLSDADARAALQQKRRGSDEEERGESGLSSPSGDESHSVVNGLVHFESPGADEA